jgi:nicotinamidase/pyrazinamidase
MSFPTHYCQGMEYGSSTALIVVDVQNDFADPAGSLYVPGGEEAIDFINEQIADAVSAGSTVVYTQDWHPETTPHFEKDGGIWPVHCVGGTSGAELHPDLDATDDAIRLRKGSGGEDGYSAFHVRDPQTGAESSTGLGEQLEDRDVQEVVVVGLALDYCVKETAIDAARAGFDTVLLADGTRAVNLSPGDGTRASAEMADAGVGIV